ncbi:MAG TPA: hypothetical protein VE776_02780 [Actinomycetota bacterium]|nr:hypothetical protein [Actinomycetota bacterium]
MSEPSQWKSWSRPQLARSIIFTNTCLDHVAGWFPWASTREATGRWLRECLAASGYVTTIPPRGKDHLKSPSGYFATVESNFVLLLHEDTEGTNAPVAYDARFSPDWVRSHGRPGALPDPFTLHGPALVRHVEFSRHSLERFHERCDGSPDRGVAEGQLRSAITATAQAVKTPPSWVSSRKPTEFFLVAGNYCLPMSIPGGAKAFEAVSCFYKPRKPGSNSTITVQCSCGHSNRLSRAQAKAIPGPRCSGCGVEMRVRDPSGM